MPQQRITFLKNTRAGCDSDSDYEDNEDLSPLETESEKQKQEKMEISMDPLSQQIQGLKLTKQQIKLLDTEQQATIVDLREWALECGQENPAFHVSVDFDVTKAEDAITNERDRLIKRKEFQQKQKAEADSRDQKEVTIKETGVDSSHQQQWCGRQLRQMK